MQIATDTVNCLIWLPSNWNTHTLCFNGHFSKWTWKKWPLQNSM